MACVAKAVHLGKTTQVWDAVVTHRDTGKTRSRLATDGSQVVTIALLGETALVATKAGGLFAIKAE